MTSRPECPAVLLVALLDEVVHQLAGAVVHLNVERLNLVREVVERHNRGNGHQKSERRRYKRFRNTTGHSADTRRLLGRDLLEGVQNSDDRAEQADEWCGGTDGRQTAKAPLQFRVNDRFRPLQCAL